MSLFEQYEEEFLTASRGVSTKIGQFNYNNGDSEAQKALSEARAGMDSARALLKQMGSDGKEFGTEFTKPSATETSPVQEKL